MTREEAHELTAQIVECDEDAYHADPAPEPSLSSSIARVLLEESPLHAWAKHPRLGATARRRESKALDRGTLIHRLILGTGATLEVVDAKDWRTKAAKLARDEAREAGRLPVLAHVFEEAELTASALRQRLADLVDPSTQEARPVEFAGRSEVAILWRELSPHGPIWCRGRLDHLDPDRALILDLKTTERSAHPEAVGRSALDYGYPIQRAAYVSAVTKLWPHLGGRVRFEVISAETNPPYAVTVGELDGTLRALGEGQWSRAVDEWGLWTSLDRWPGYGRARIEAPPWLASKLARGEA